MLESQHTLFTFATVRAQQRKISTMSDSNQWTIDGAHSSVSFSVRHMMISNVRGEFQKLSGSVTWDPAKPEATQINTSIEVASISTREAQRDGHLKSADFLDAENFPDITFKSTSAKANGKDSLSVVGDLTIHGTTKQVTLDVEGPSAEAPDPFGNRRVGATATTKIKRDEFGMVWNAALEAGGVLVGNEVKVTIDISLIKQK